MPEVEPLVAPFRARFDPSGSRGVPAHITLLFPFVPASHLTDPILSALRARFDVAAPFDYRLARTDRFLEVVYLAPEPAGRSATSSGSSRATGPTGPRTVARSR